MNSGVLGGTYRVCLWVVRLAWSNIIWIFLNLPVLYFCLSLLNAEYLNITYILLLIMGLVPIFSFPSTVALFGVVRKWVMGESDIPIATSFLRYYKENYFRSFIGGIVFTLMWAGWIMNYISFVSQQSVIFLVLYAFFTMILLTWTLYFCCYTVHIHDRLLQSIKNSFIMSVGRPISTLGVVMVTAILIYISIGFTFLWPFFTGTILAFLSFSFFYRIIEKTIHYQNQTRDSGLNAREEKTT